MFQSFDKANGSLVEATAVTAFVASIYLISQAMSMLDAPVEVDSEEEIFVSIDVEAAATGNGHLDR